MCKCVYKNKDRKKGEPLYIIDLVGEDKEYWKRNEDFRGWKHLEEPEYGCSIFEKLSSDCEDSKIAYDVYCRFLKKLEHYDEGGHFAIARDEKTGFIVYLTLYVADDCLAYICDPNDFLLIL